MQQKRLHIIIDGRLYIYNISVKPLSEFSTRKRAEPDNELFPQRNKWRNEVAREVDVQMMMAVNDVDNDDDQEARKESDKKKYAVHSHASAITVVVTPPPQPCTSMLDAPPSLQCTLDAKVYMQNDICSTAQSGFGKES